MSVNFQKQHQQSTLWVVQNRRLGYMWEGKLAAYWEIEHELIKGYDTPEIIGAEELFELWVKQVTPKYPDQLIPIFWFVVCQAEKVFEFMPFQYQKRKPLSNFLDHFTWPKHKETGEYLNWLTLPVVDKYWHQNCYDKGGFIQETTHWKPGILQPYVFLPSLLQYKKK